MPEFAEAEFVSLPVGGVFHRHRQRGNGNIGFGESSDLVGSQSFVCNGMSRTAGLNGAEAFSPGHRCKAFPSWPV